MRAEQAELDARLAEAKVLTLKSEEQLNVLNTRITRLRKQRGCPMSLKSKALGGLILAVARALWLRRPAQRSGIAGGGQRLPEGQGRFQCAAYRAQGRDPRR
jgi:hypothetical protein